jgi:biopolymer transport protein ExbB
MTQGGDWVHLAVALVLLAMSVLSWVLLLYKTWVLRAARRDVPRCVAAFWQAPDWGQAVQNLRAFDRHNSVLPLVLAAQPLLRAAPSAPAANLGNTAPAHQQLTRALRDALSDVVMRLQMGQVLLATVGATAPFVGLLGTVWGIYQAMGGIAAAGTATIDRMAGPVGEALIMTAAGLAVAIPAVLAYNMLGRWVAALEAALEGFALDLQGLLPEPSR